MQYMAPEILKGKSHSSSAEIFSLGCIFTELIAMAHGITPADYANRRKKHEFARALPRITDIMQRIARDNEQLAPLIYTCLKLISSEPNERILIHEVHAELVNIATTRNIRVQCCTELPELASESEPSSHSTPQTSEEDLTDVLAGIHIH